MSWWEGRYHKVHKIFSVGTQPLSDNFGHRVASYMVWYGLVVWKKGGYLGFTQ